MRDPDRIDAVLAKVKEAWELYPDMRLGQLIIVVSGGRGLFAMEEDELVKGLDDYIKTMGGQS